MAQILPYNAESPHDNAARSEKHAASHRDMHGGYAMPKRHTAQGHEMMAPPEDDAIAMLKADHRKVLHLFRQYDATRDQERQQRIAEDVFEALALLGQLEDAVFYPAFAEAGGEEGERLGGGARQGNQLFKGLMAGLRGMGDAAGVPGPIPRTRGGI